MIATSIEQSKKLFKYGLNPDTADMVYTSMSDIIRLNIYVLEVRNINENFNDNEIPAWSLGELIDISYKCGWYSDFDFEIGGNDSIELIDECVKFIIDMLSDNSNNRNILDWQEKYKINNNE